MKRGNGLRHNSVPKSVREPESFVRYPMNSGPLRWMPLGTSLQIVLGVQSWA